MPFSSGHRIGAYEIVAPLGAGGMGEVYRARDSKLKREVALKVLPADVANDRERLARFQREAEVLASLNHPHIAHVYGIEENALVMELVEGEDLAERLRRGAIPIDDALPIARQIAEAVEAAHDAGIIHRDLKPGNIKVRDDGTVKVLDFGLAKALDPGAGSRDPGSDLANSPTITSPAMTMRGVILGTAAYMSPEQAKGKAVDKRADIWAFGCVLFEMLTGQRPFKGDDVTDIITSVMRDAPDWNALPATTPLGIRTLLRRCLEKDPRKRAPHMAVARIEIDDAMASTGELMAGGAVAPARGMSYAAVAAIAIVCMGLAAGGAWLALRPGEASPRPVIRATWPIPMAGGLRMGVQRNVVALSANGRALAIISNGVQMRATDAMPWTAIPNTMDATSVFASPDGGWIGYSNRAGIWKVRLTGGEPLPIATVKDSATFGVYAAAWGDDHRIYYTDRTGLYSVADDGNGAPQRIVEGTDFDAAIHVLPGGRGLIYGRGRLPAASVVLHRFGAEPPIPVGEGASGKFVAPDLLIFVRNETLMAVRFDLAGGKMIGEPLALSDDIAVAAVLSGTPQYDVSRDGVLVYFPAGGTSTAGSLLTVRGLDGALSPLAPDVRMHSDPRLSPDAKRLALHIVGGQDDIWIYEIERGAMTRFTFEPGEDETPAWSPDGQWLAFAGTVRGGDGRAVFRRRADGSGAEEVLWSSLNHSHVNDWSRDGRSVLAEVVDPKRRSDLVLIDVTAKTMAPLIATPFNEAAARVSPDGHWVAYHSDESGRAEVFIQAFPSLGHKVQVSIGGGEQPAWSRDGRTLYFRSESEFKSARVESGAGKIELSAPVTLFPDTFLRPQVVHHTTYEVFPDGRMLLFRHPADVSARDAVVVGVFNWLDDVRRKLK